MRLLNYQIRVSITVWEILAITAIVLAVSLAWPAAPMWVFWVVGGTVGGIEGFARERAKRRKATSCSPA